MSKNSAYRKISIPVKNLCDRICVETKWSTRHGVLCRFLAEEKEMVSRNRSLFNPAILRRRMARRTLLAVTRKKKKKKKLVTRMENRAGGTRKYDVKS